MFNATFNNILVILWSRSFYLKGHVTYCHHFVSLIVVANKRLHFSVLVQLDPNVISPLQSLSFLFQSKIHG
jgi:hypothetical protein